MVHARDRTGYMCIGGAVSVSRMRQKWIAGQASFSKELESDRSDLGTTDDGA